MSERLHENRPPAEIRESANIVELAADWLSAASSRVKLTTELAMAEAKLAAISLALMAFLGVIAALFVVGAWGLVVAGIVAGLVQAGMSLWISLAIVGVIHVFLAFLILRAALGLGDHMKFSATRRQFMHSGDQRDAPDTAKAAG